MSSQKNKATSNSKKELLESLKKENESLKKEIASLGQSFLETKREQSEYLQNVAHQLVAPLNAIKWHIENLTAGRLSPDRIQKVLRSIYAQSTISVHRAKNFALMSNLDADHELNALSEPLQPTNLCKLMVHVADDFQPLGWDREIKTIVKDKPLDDAPHILAIRSLIGQVFSNIVENAVKYSISVSTITICGQHNSEDDTVTVSISNKGLPLPSENIDSVFKRGYRSQGAKNMYPAGTGFGLFIAKRIVDIHKGTIRGFNNEEGLTIFEVTLPVKQLAGKAKVINEKNNTTHR